MAIWPFLSGHFPLTVCVAVQRRKTVHGLIVFDSSSTRDFPTLSLTIRIRIMRHLNKSPLNPVDYKVSIFYINAKVTSLSTDWRHYDRYLA